MCYALFRVFLGLLIGTVLASLAFVYLLVMFGVDMYEYPKHNKYGGYVDACGELPPLVGDDC